LLHAFHRAGINGIDRFAVQVRCERGGLFMAARREAHINGAAEDALIAGFDFCVANEQERGGVQWEKGGIRSL